MLVLGLTAYVLFLRRTDRIEESEGARLLEDVAISAPDHPDWMDYLRATTEGDSLFQWHFWETLLWEERGGIITFDHYLPLAFAYLLGSGKASNQGLRDDFTTDQQFYVERVLKAFDELEAEPWAHWLGPLPRAAESRAGVRDLLDMINRSIEAQVIAQPLDSSRVQQFMNAASEEWQSQKSVMPRISSGFLDEGIDRSTLSSEPRRLGVNQLFPKDYFAPTHVLAEPKDLAQALMRGLARGETEFWLQTLGRNVDQHLVEADEFRAQVVTAVAEMRKRKLQPAVVVFRDWRLLDRLRGEDVDYTQRFDEAHVNGASITLSYENVPFSCIVADFIVVGRLLYSRLSPSQPVDRILDDGRVLVGVEAIDADRAAQLWQRNPALAVSESGEPPSQDDALHLLQQRVIVRIFEEVAFRLDQADAAEVFQVSEERATP
jgi:hypothetical protein